MTKRHVDYAGSPFPVATLDTGTTAATAIRPILNGEVATQTTLQRPDENLRTRTEIVRTELEQLKYLSQADRAMVMSLEPVTPAGTITWNGTVAGGGGGTGTFVLTAGKSLTTRPFLSPRVSTPGKIINRGLKFQTNLTVAGPINPPRAYGSANKYNVQFVNQTGGPVTVTYDPLLFRFTVNTDTAVRTKTDVINAFNAAATSAGQGITATIDSGFGTDIFASGVTFIQGDPADYMVFAGAADAEIHQIQDTTFASFFTDPLNAMEENDVLAIWYDDHTNGLFGGRQQSIIDSPEAPTISIIPVGSLFLARRFPERLHIAIPIATVTNNELLLADGTLARKGIPTLMTGGASELPQPMAPDSPPKFLRMFTSSPPVWETVDDIDLIGGLMSVADVFARNAIPAAQRKAGMVAYTQADDLLWQLSGGILDANWVKVTDDSRIHGGMRVIDWTTPTYADVGAALSALVPAVRRKHNMLVRARNTGTGYTEDFRYDASLVSWRRDTQISALGRFGVASGCAVANPDNDTVTIGAGEFYLLDGTKVVVPSTINFSMLTYNGTYVIVWASNTQNFDIIPANTAVFPDMVFAHVVRTADVVTKFIPCAPTFRALPWTGEITIGYNVGTGAIPAHFTHLRKALIWYSSYYLNVGIPRTFRVIDDTQFSAYSILTSATSAISSGGVLTDISGRFLRDLAVGDGVRIDSTNYTVSVITDSNTLTLSGWAGGSVTSKSLYRLDAAARYGESYVDLSYAEYVNGYYRGMAIIGQSWSQTGARPNIGYGNNTYAATKPWFSGNGADGCLFSGLSFQYYGLQNQDASRHDCVVFKALGTRTTLRDITVDAADNSAGYGLTHIINLSSDIGGHTYITGGMVIDRCQFYDIDHPMGSYLYVPTSSVDGTIDCIDTTFAQSSTAYKCPFLIHYEQETASVKLRLRNPRVVGLDCAFAAGIRANKESLSVIGGVIGSANDAWAKLGVGTYRDDDEWPDGDQDRSKYDASATVSSVSGTVATITGLSGMSSPADVGKLMRLSLTALTGNKGLFVITQVDSASQARIENASASAADGNNGSIATRVFEPSEKSSTLTLSSVDGNGIVTATGMSAVANREFVGQTVLIGNASVSANNGKFIVMDRSGTTIKFYNPSANATDVNNGSIIASVYSEKLPSITVEDAAVDENQSGGGLDFQGCRSVDDCGSSSNSVQIIRRKSAVFSSCVFLNPSSKAGALLVVEDHELAFSNPQCNEISPKMVAKAWSVFSWNFSTATIGEYSVGCTVTRDGGGDDSFIVTLGNNLAGIGTGPLGVGLANAANLGVSIVFSVTPLSINQFRLTPWVSNTGVKFDLDTNNISQVNFVCFGFAA